MAKTKTKPEINFLENPDNVTIGDWVKDIHSNKVGRIDSRVETGPNMLEFWIKFLDTTLGTALAKDLRKVEAPTSITKSIDLSLVIIDPDLQQRVKLDESIIEEYAIALSNGEVFPPITVWHNTEDGRNYLIDGFHRVEAAKKAGINELPFTIKQGEFREAILYSVSINSTHGLRRSKEDKRKSVMTLLQDEEWNGWSNREIAIQCNVSHPFVGKLREEFESTILENNELSGNVSRYKKRKCIRNGKEYEMDVSQLVSDNSSNGVSLDGEDGKENQSVTNNNLPDPAPEFNDSGFLPEDNYPEDNHYYPEDVIKDLWDDDNDDDSVNDSVSEDSLIDNEDNLELGNNEDKPENTTPTSTKRPKRSKKKSRLVNPLSVGDKVKVKDNHYFGGKEGLVTQIANVNSVIVAFEDNHHQLLYLKDLDLPESLQKPLLQKPQRPRKKEIVIKEGLNYFAGSLGSNCKWYLEVQKHIYEGLKIYQSQINAIDIERILSDFLIEKGILKPHPDDSTRFLEYDEKPSPINSLNSETRNKLENIVEKHGVDAIFKMFRE